MAPRALGNPNTAGEYPYDPSERFSVEEREAAGRLRKDVKPDPDGSKCPHTPRCPSVNVCLEEIAWYLRYRRDIHAIEARLGREET